MPCTLGEVIFDQPATVGVKQILVIAG